MMPLKRQSILKTVLWALFGVLVVLTLVRFLRGLGATTGLSDTSPWGFWIAFDVMGGVALAAGGFVVAATVYIFGREKYHCFARPAILTAFLGYAAVAVGLLYDLGLPWNIWHPLIFPQPQSVLFEVAMCVMLYLAVLFLEFSPVILEHPRFNRPILQKIHKLLKKAAIPLVIAGIVLSTLHQSSLGSLFLIAPYRLHALWYSPIIWILFFVSAIGLGFMMVVAESFFSSWFFKHKLRLDLLGGLGKAAAVVLFLYAGLRLGDLALRGEIGGAFDGSWQASLFLFEIALSALVPATLLVVPRIRRSAWGLATASGMTVFGMLGYRFDVSIVAFARSEGMSYFPTWGELGVSLGIVAGALLVFIFFVERLRVYPEEHAEPGAAKPEVPPRPSYDPGTVHSLLPAPLAMPRRYSLAMVAAAAATIALIPQNVLFGDQLFATPVRGTRTLEGYLSPRPTAPGHEISVAQPFLLAPAGAEKTRLLLIDGNRDGRVVLFPHDRHVPALGGDGACALCHHLNMPFDRNTSCSECHRDMYRKTDIFDHLSHHRKLGGNSSCARCHRDSSEVKSRSTAAACGECHTDLVAPGSRIAPPKEGLRGFAPGYMDAMHGLCINCHQEKAKEASARLSAGFADCATCHRDFDARAMHRMPPYAASGEAR
jgi:Ni/Fe-hydrogenase subunit HybB-like protein